jgi:signal transduction histidine kinase
MKANVMLHVSIAPSAVFRELKGAVLRIPERLRHRRFWYIQAMVVVATAAHYGFEIAGYTATEGAMHDLAITAYVVPLLYAAMTFGWEGTFMTALWAVILTSPSTWIWHHSQLHWVGEVMQLGLIMGVGVVVAWRVDRESKQRQIAERTSASLSLLNKVGETLSNPMEVEHRLPLVLDTVVSGLKLQSAVLSLEPGNPDAGPIIIAGGAARPCLSASASPQILGLQAAGVFNCPDEYRVLVGLDADGHTIGSLSACPQGSMGDDRANLLAAICHEIAVAVENGRLYRERQESMRWYVRQVTQAHEDERLRIARELHDDTAQELIHLVRRLERLQDRADSTVSSEARDTLVVARTILSGLRRFIRDLRPSVLDDLGLLAAIEMVVGQSNEILPGGARLHISGEPRRLDSQVEVVLFRIAQEALRNVAKHANAQTAQVWLSFETDYLILTVQDDGVGVSLPANLSDLARVGKLGVLGMKERAELVGGTFEVAGRSGRGTATVVRVPSRERDQSRALDPGVPAVP